MSKLSLLLVLFVYINYTIAFHVETYKGKPVIHESTADAIKKKSEIAGAISGTSVGVAKAAMKKPIIVKTKTTYFQKVKPEKPKYKYILVSQKVPILVQEPTISKNEQLYKKVTKTNVKKTNLLKLSVFPYFKGYFKGKTFGKILGKF